MSLGSILIHRLALPLGVNCVLAALLCVPLFAGERKSYSFESELPNILIILADDMGYADLGCFGGEIETPHLDRLAAEGVRFSHFRATPMCITTRVALMAGMSYPAAGNGSYDGALPLPALLREHGYRTMMTGKWHAGRANPRSPELFDRFFGFMGGMTDAYAGGADWFEGQRPYKNFGVDFDATEAITERSIEYMQEALDEGEPFFMFVSYNAPHHPLQARRETVEKYRDRYLKGYEAVRNQRLSRQIAMGLIDPHWKPAPHGVEVRQWDELPSERKEVEAFRMASYAAMIDEMDQAIGRIIDFLEDEAILDETFILFFSDNGGDYNNGSILTDARQIPWQASSNPTTSNGWAWVKNTPFAYYKHSSHEGALAVPCIIHWPVQSNQQAGKILDVTIAVTDIYPTLLEIAGITYPQDELALKPLTGKSFLPVLTDGDEFDAPSRFLWFNQSRAWIENGMKAVSFYQGPWALYDMRNDRTEQVNLANSQPDDLRYLSGKWNAYAKQIRMPPKLRKPAGTTQKGWGWHRLKMFSPQLLKTVPENSQLTSSGLTSLEMHFSAPVDFSSTPGRFIRLYEVSDESQPVWELDPDNTHPSQGRRIVSFEGIPPLKPDTQYFVMIEPRALKVGGKPVNVINDGAYWWRFRTTP